MHSAALWASVCVHDVCSMCRLVKVKYSVFT